jgi:mitochondrial fission protein ELM1
MIDRKDPLESMGYELVMYEFISKSKSYHIELVRDKKTRPYSPENAAIGNKITAPLQQPSQL